MNLKITDTTPLDKNTLRGVFSLVVGPMKIEMRQNQSREKNMRTASIFRFGEVIWIRFQNL